MGRAVAKSERIFGECPNEGLQYGRNERMKRSYYWLVQPEKRPTGRRSRRRSSAEVSTDHRTLSFQFNKKGIEKLTNSHQTTI